jgi:hypothetical protein
MPDSQPSHDARTLASTARAVAMLVQERQRAEIRSLHPQLAIEADRQLTASNEQCTAIVNLHRELVLSLDIADPIERLQTCLRITHTIYGEALTSELYDH